MSLGVLTESDAFGLLMELREGLKADGYDLRVSKAAGKLHLQIVAMQADACEDCLVPKEIMAQIAAMAIHEKHSEVTADDIVLQYPAEH